MIQLLNNASLALSWALFTSKVGRKMFTNAARVKNLQEDIPNYDIYYNLGQFVKRWIISLNALDMLLIK